MKLIILYVTLVLCACLEVGNARICRKRLTRIEEGRKCRRPCITDADCKAPNKKCNCDGWCGMSCYNPDAVCGEPEEIAHGRMTVSGVTMQSTASYICDEGFVLEGDHIRTCCADKKWHPEAPKCQRGCQRPNHIGSSYPLLGGDTLFNVGAEVTYRCRTGYYNNDDEPMRVRCLESGQWSVGRFICKLQICDQIPEVLNGRVTYTSQYYFGSIATVVCNKGHEPKNGALRIYCEAGDESDSSAEWSSSLARCSKIRCPPPLKPRNGFVKYVSVTRDEFGTEISYSCEDGYKMEGDSLGQCNEESDWGAVPECYAHVNCTFTNSAARFSVETCGYSNQYWEQSQNYIYASRENSLLTSPHINEDYAIEGRLCAVFRYLLNRNTRTILQFMNRSQSDFAAWTAHPQEIRHNWLTSFVNFPAERNLKYQFRASIGVQLEFVELRRSNCADFCELAPCMNGGTCVSRLGSYTCFCRVGFIGEQCQHDIKCGPPPVSLKFTNDGKIHYESPELLLRGSTVTYQCIEDYKLSGREFSTSFTSTCQSISYSASAWQPPFGNNRCEADLNCTFTRRSGRETCGYTNVGWNFAAYYAYNAVAATRPNSVLTSPKINHDYAFGEYVCVVFTYVLHQGSSLLLQEINGSGIRYPAWKSHQQEKKYVNRQSFLNIHIPSRPKYEFLGSGSVFLKEIKARRTKCPDFCLSEPCMNGGTCLNRLENFVCFCALGFNGDRCQNDIKCNSPPASLPFTQHQVIGTTESGLLLRGSTVTYKCIEHYKLYGQESSTSFTSTCQSMSYSASAWLPSFENVRCEADLNCTFTRHSHRQTCGYTNVGWGFAERVGIVATQSHSVLTSPKINVDYASGGHICVVFTYVLHDGSSLQVREIDESGVRYQGWTSHPQERKMVDLISFLNIPFPRVLQFDFLVSGRAMLKLIRGIRTKCYDFCLPDPCMNGGTCLHRLDNFVCFCAVGFNGDRCQNDIKCASPPAYLPSSQHKVIGNRASRLLLRDSTVTYKCIEHYKLYGQESSTSFHSTCRSISDSASTWIPSFENVRCEADLNCTFTGRSHRQTCGYTNVGWEHYPDDGIVATHSHSVLTSPIINDDYASGGHICVVFTYVLHGGSSLRLREIDESGKRYPGWASNPLENKGVNLVSFLNVPFRRHIQFEFLGSERATLMKIQVERAECHDFCLSEPCENGGCCLNRLRNFVCLCALGFNGDRCQNDIKCTSPPAFLPSTQYKVITNNESGLLLRGSTVTYKCIENYVFTGRESSTSFTSTCQRISYSESAWQPPYKKELCEADVNCTFARNDCGYSNQGWKRTGLESGFSASQDNSSLISPPLNENYAIEGCLCAVFQYLINRDAVSMLQFIDRHQSDHVAWTSHPQEERTVWLTSFVNFPFERNLQYQLRASRGVRLKYVELRRRNCEDFCVSEPCMNNGTCVSRLESYTCFCVAGFSGKQCQHDIKCSSPPDSLSFSKEKVTDEVESGLLLRGSIVTYQCIENYTFTGRESSTSFTSTCQSISDDKSAWQPPFKNIGCEADVNCTFRSGYCGYVNQGWKLSDPRTNISALQDNSSLASPPINGNYTAEGRLCAVFEYLLNQSAFSTLQFMVLNQSDHVAWTSHPQEKRNVSVTSFVNFLSGKNLRYQLVASSGVQLKYVELRRSNCEDLCASGPCMNGGTCVSRFESYTCFCVAGFSGEQCQHDIKCSSPPPSLQSTREKVIANNESGLLLPGSTVTYRCIKNYVFAGPEFSTSFTSTCQNISDSGSAWLPSFANVGCQADLNCTFNRDFCNYINEGWKLSKSKNFTRATQRNAMIASPQIRLDYAVEEHICVMFKYYFRHRTSSLVLKMDGHGKSWKSHPKEKRKVLLISFMNFPAKQNLRYRFLASRGVLLKYVKLRRSNCDDRCLSDPCLNDGACVNRFKKYVCLCRSGFTGKQCQFDIRCGPPPASFLFTNRGKIQYKRSGSELLRGTTVTYDCMEGHKLSGPEFSTSFNATCTKTTKIESAWRPSFENVRCEKILADNSTGLVINEGEE